MEINNKKCGRKTNAVLNLTLRSEFTCMMIQSDAKITGCLRN